MPSHRRGRSLSEALTLEQSEDGALVVSSINTSISASQGLKEGDEVLGATINFGHLSKDEVLQVLKLMEPFDDKIEVVTRDKRSKSIGNLDQYIKNPETMLQDSYNKFYNAKIKRFMRNGEESSVDKDVTAKPTVPASSKVNLNHNTELPRLGVDFGLKTKKLSRDVNSDSQCKDTGELNYGTNLNLPPLSLGSIGRALSRAQVPRMKVNVRSPQLDTPDFHSSTMLQEDSNVNSAAGVQPQNTDSPVADLSMPNLDRPHIGLQVNEKLGAQEVGLNLKGSDVRTPDMGINLNKNVPKLKLPNSGFSEDTFIGPEYKVKTQDEGIPDVLSGESKIKFSQGLKNPDLNVDDLSSYAESPEVNPSGKSSDLDREKPGISVPQPSLSGLDIDITSQELKVQLKKSKMDFRSTYLDVDAPPGKLTWPKTDMTVKNGACVKAPDQILQEAKLKGPNLATDISSADSKVQGGKYKAPKFIMPKFDLPHIQDLVLNGDLVGPDIQPVAPDVQPDLILNAPNIKGGLEPPGVDIPKMSLKAPKLDVNAPKVNIASPKAKLKMPKLKIPKFSLPSSKDINGSSDGPDINFNAPNVNFNGSNPDLDIPIANVAGPGISLKMPDLRLSGPKLGGPNLDLRSPDLDVSGPSLSGGINARDIDIPKVDLKNPKLDLNTPEFNFKKPSDKLMKPELHAPNWDVSPPSGELKRPQLKLSGTFPKGPNWDLNSGLESPDLTLKAPKIKGGIKSHDFDDPTMNLKAPKFDVNIDSPKSKLKMHKLKMPKFGHPNSKAPEISGSFYGPDMNLNAPNVNFNGSKPDLEIPDSNVAGSGGIFKIPDITLPNVGNSGPKLGGPNLDLKSPGLDISGPNLSGGINAPDIDIPKVDLKNPKLDLNTQEFNFKKPSGKLMKPEFHAPNWDVSPLSGELKTPQLKLSGTFPKGPNLDLNTDLKSPDLALKAPKIKDSIKTLDFDDPKMNLKSPKLDVNIGSPKSKLKMPKLKMPKFGLPSLKGPEISESLDGPDMNLNAPNVNVKGLKPDLEISDGNVTGIGGNFNIPDITLPNVGNSGPKLGSPNLDLKSPGLDISGPNLRGGINAPDIDIPKVDLKNPKLDLNTQEFNFKKPSGKLMKPEFHAPNWDVSPLSGELKTPQLKLSGTFPKGPNLDLNTDLKSPDLALKAPKIKDSIKTLDFDDPKMNLKSPKLDVNIGSPKSKLKMPKLKMPKFGLPILKGPEISESLDGPDMNLNAPNVNVKGLKPDSEISDGNVTGIGGNFNIPDITLPNVGNSGPKLGSPNLDLKSPGLDISGPNLRGGINAPDIDIPKVDLKKPKLDLNGPEFNLKKPSGKLVKPELHTPNWDVSPPSGEWKMPQLKLSETLPKGPNLDLNSGLESPDLTLKAPKIKGGIKSHDFDDPTMNLKAPKFDVNAPKVNIGSPKSKLKMHKLKMPKFGLPSLKGPEINGSFDGLDMSLDSPNMNFKAPKADLDIPDADIDGSAGKFKMPNITLPEVEFSRPKFSSPNLDLKSPSLDIAGPNLNGGIKSPDIDMPKVNLKNPKLDLSTPDFDFKTGKLIKPEFNNPDLDINASSGKLKIPKVNLSGTLPKGPNVDLTSDLKSTEFNSKSPKGGIESPDLDLPKVDLKAPQLDVIAPQVNIGSPKSKLKMPKIKMPKFGHQSQLKGPQIHGSVNGPYAALNVHSDNWKGPKADLQTSDIGISNSSVNLKKTGFSLPDFGLSGPELNGPNLKLKSSKIDISNPNLSGINAEVPGPDWNVRYPLGKSQKFSLFGTLPKEPNMNINPEMKSPDLSLKNPNINGGINTSDLDLPKAGLENSKLNVDIPDVNTGSPKAKLSMPKLKMPKFSLKRPAINGNLDRNGLNVDLNTPTVNPTGLKRDFDIDVGGSLGKFKKPNFDMPDFSISDPKFDGPDFGLKSTNLDISGPKFSGGIKAPDINQTKVDLKSPRLDLDAPKVDKPDFDMSCSPNADLKAPMVNMNTPDVSIGLPEASIKKYKIKMPKGPNVERNGNIPDTKFITPQVKGEANDFEVNVLSGKIQDPLLDHNFADRKFKLPSLKLPQFGAPVPNREGSDIDFGTSIRSANTDISPPNAKLNMKPPQMRGNVTGLNVSDPIIDLTNPKAAMPNSPLNFKNPDLNVDDSSLNLSPYKDPRSDIAEANMKMPTLDVDKDVRLPYTDKKPSRMKVRSSCPQRNANFGHHIDLNRSDLNVDDFTGKDHVLRARGSKQDLQILQNSGHVSSPSGVKIDMTDSRYNIGIPTSNFDIHAKALKTTQILPNASLPNLSNDGKSKISNSTDGYYVTVFPTQEQNTTTSNNKHNTLGRPGLYMDLDVPDENDLKGSTYFFSNLI